MNKKMWWIIGGIIVIALIAYFMFGNRSANNSVTSDANTTKVADDSQMAPKAQSKSLKDLMMSNTPTTCTFSDNTNASAKTEGKVYIANKKVRGDFSTTMSGKATMAHMVMDNADFYTWIDGQKDGFKITMTAQQKAKADNAQNKGIDPDKKMDYNCGAWSGDDSYFKLPIDIQFKDMSALMTPAAQTQNNTSVNIKTQQCAACDAAGASRDQCRTMLGCK